MSAPAPGRDHQPERPRRLQLRLQLRERRGRALLHADDHPIRPHARDRCFPDPGHIANRIAALNLGGHDDSPSIDTEIFNLEEFEGSDWVVVSDEVPR